MDRKVPPLDVIGLRDAQADSRASLMLIGLAGELNRDIGGGVEHLASKDVRIVLPGRMSECNPRREHLVQVIHRGVSCLVGGEVAVARTAEGGQEQNFG